MIRSKEEEDVRLIRLFL